MILTFSQGIVSHQTDLLGTQQFLLQTGGNVTLNVSPDPTVLAFAHRDTHYLFTESITVANAWLGPFSSGTDYYLFWDINLSTGIRTFGHTLLEPVTSSSPPLNPPVDLHWYDTTKRIMKYWNGVSWVEVLRVFAAKYESATNFISMSINSPAFVGTQVGIEGNFEVGSLIFDPDGNPLKRNRRRFFTSEDLFTTGLPTSSRVRIESFVVDGLAVQPMAAYTAVSFSDFHEISPLNPTTHRTSVFGLIEKEVIGGELVKVTVDGVVNNLAWDWDFVNQQIFTDSTGQLVTVAGGYTPLPEQVPVALAIDKTTILLRPARLTLDGSGAAAPVVPATTVALGTVLISVPPTDPLLPIAVEDNDPRLDPSFQHDPTAHTHVKAEILDFAHDSDHDGRFYTQTLLDAGQLDTRYYPIGILDASFTTTGAKVDKVNGVLGNFVEIDGVGNLVDSGVANGAWVLKAGDNMDAGANLTFSSTGEVLGLPNIPTTLGSAASKFYVDQIASGIHVRESVKASTTGPLPASTYTQLPAQSTLIANVNGALPAQDGFSLSVNDRLLVQNQVSGLENGVYVINQLGDGSSPWIMSRCVTCDESIEIPGSFVFVEQGTVHQALGYFAITVDGFVLGVDDITWTPISSAGAGLLNVVEDLTPQLGGNLDLNLFDIVSIDETGTNASREINIVQGASGNTATAVNDINIVASDNSGITGTADGGSINLIAGDSANGFGGSVNLIVGDATSGPGIVSILNSNITGTVAPELHFSDGDASNTIALRAPDTVTSDVVWTLPDDTPGTVVGQVVTTDAFGNLGFVSLPPSLPTGINCGDMIVFDNFFGHVNVENRTLIPYDFAVFAKGTPSNGELIFKFKSTRAWTLYPTGDIPKIALSAPSGINQASAEVAGVGISTFELRRGVTVISTITFAAAATTATFSAFTAHNFSENDELRLVAITVDPALTDIGFSFLGGLIQDCSVL